MVPMPDAIPSLEDDPCGRATALKAKKDEIITGGGVLEIDKEHGNGVRRRVKFGAANMAALDAEIRAADNACRVKQGKRPSRFAATPRGNGW